MALPDNYAGQGAIYGGQVDPGTVVPPIYAFIDSMAPGTMQLYPGTNINEMETSNFEGLPNGILESTANYSIPQWSGKASFDPVAGLMSGVGTSQGFTSFSPAGERSKAIYFDCATNRFSVKWNPVGKNDGHVYDGNVSRPHNGFVYRRSYGSNEIRKMHVATKVWSVAFVIPGLTNSVASIDVFPDLGANGTLVVITDLGRVFTADLGTGASTDRGLVAGTANYPVAMYVQSAQCVVFGGGNTGTKLYKINAAGAISEIVQTLPTGLSVACDATYGPSIPHPGGQAAIVTMSHPLNAAYKLDVSTGAWAKQIDFPTAFQNLANQCMAISMHGRGAVALWRGRGRSAGVTQSEFWLYRA